MALRWPLRTIEIVTNRCLPRHRDPAANAEIAFSREHVSRGRPVAAAVSALNELSSELLALLEITGKAWQQIQRIFSRGDIGRRLPDWPFDAAGIKALPAPLDSVSQPTWIYWFLYKQINDTVRSQEADEIKPGSPLVLALERNTVKLRFQFCDTNSDGKPSKSSCDSTRPAPTNDSPPLVLSTATACPGSRSECNRAACSRPAADAVRR